MVKSPVPDAGKARDALEQNPPEKTFHHVFFWCVLVAGLALTYFAFLVEPGLWGWDIPFVLAKHESVVQSVLTNVGTGFLLAAGLAPFEGTFRRVIRKAAEGGSKTAVKEMTGSFEGRIARLEDDFDRIEQDIKEVFTAQEEALNKASADFSYEHVFELMERAVDYGALANNQITVQATARLGEFVVTLACHDEPVNRVLAPEEQGRRLRVMVTTEKGMAEQTWSSTERFPDVVKRLLQDLSSIKAWALAQDVSWREAKRRLLDGIGIALRANNKMKGAVALHGRLAEVVTEGWFITDVGLECPEQSHEPLLRRGDFPQVWEQGGFGGLYSTPPIDEYQKPTWADQDTWNYAVKRCSERYTSIKDVTGTMSNRTEVPRETLGQEY